jgi:hypothetical protein
MRKPQAVAIVLAMFLGLFGCLPPKSELFALKDQCLKEANQFEKSWPKDSGSLDMTEFTNHYDAENNVCYVQRLGTVGMSVVSQTVRQVFDAQEDRVLYSCTQMWKHSPSESNPACTAQVEGITRFPTFKAASAAMDKLMGHHYEWPN